MSTKFSFDFIDDEGNEVTLEMPGKKVVCHRCDGTGHHTNPSIDGHGIGHDE